MPTQADFDGEFRCLFETEFPRLFRYLDRLGGDADLAADLAQEAFVRLYRRGSFPDAPQAWLVTVALNLFRNERSRSARRGRLLTAGRARSAHADPGPAPAAGVEAEESRRMVRAALERLPDRERQLLLLSTEGYSYREIAGILGLPAASVGKTLARARDAFRHEVRGET